MDPSLAQVVHWLHGYKYLALLPIVIVEGPGITVIAGFLSSLGYFNILGVYTIVVAGNLCGDSMYYAAGLWGRGYFLGRWGRFFGITSQQIAQLQEYFSRHAAKTLMIGKLAQGIGLSVLVAAGMAKVPYGKFMGYNLIATLPKSLLLLFIGYYFGQSYARISRYLDYTALGMLALSLLLIILYFVTRKIAKNFFDES